MTFDYSNIRGEIRRMFGTETEFAHQIGMSRGTLTSRFAGRTQFTASEIYEICAKLKLPITENSSYFFCVNGSEKSNKGGDQT